jgi:GNAT superfamily N-acetyltransferase
MLSLEPITADDFDALFELRMASMLENLQRLGLGYRQRSLERFRSQFEPEYMSWILRDGERIGFTKLQPRDGHLHIDHLFIEPGRQGSGVGRWVLDRAKSHGQDITLSTLKLSPANEFYLRQGFVPTGEQEFDIQYRWSAPQ